MPSITHETLVELVRNRPSLVPALLADLLRVDVPAHEQARIETADLTELMPTEYRADAVVVLRSGAGVPVLAVVVEVQLHRNRRKRRTWPAYVAALHDRWNCPTALLVICVDPAVADWCAQPIDFGPGWRGVPLVLGPDLVPIPSPADESVAKPEMAVLAALAHGGGPDYRAALDALVEALSHADEARAASYAGYVIAALPEVARTYLEALMKTVDYRYQGEYAHSLEAQGRAEGKAEGKADGVLTVLEARGVEISAEFRERIGGCTDVDQLDVWLRRAVTADSVDDLFG